MLSARLNQLFPVCLGQALVSFGLVLSSVVAQADPGQREIPRLLAPVMDEVGILQSDDVDVLERQIRALQDQVQVQVWVIKSLEGEPIENLSIRATDQWKLGRAKTDNGVLILVALADHKIRLEVGRGLEGVIPDVTVGRMIREILVPRFREGQYREGLSDVVRRIGLAAKGEPLPPLESGLPRRFPGFILLLLLLGLGVFYNLVVRGGGATRGVRRYGGVWGTRGGSWSNWTSGGGGWSGGGGTFGGGGASGSW